VTYANVHEAFLHDMVRGPFHGEAEDRTRYVAKRSLQYLNFLKDAPCSTDGTVESDVAAFISTYLMRNLEHLYNGIVSWNSYWRDVQAEMQFADSIP
jgi:hypothetical protein